MKKNLCLQIALLSLGILISVSSLSQQSQVIVQLKDVSQDTFWSPLTDQLRFGDKGSTAFMSVDWNKGQGSFFGELKINQGAGFASYRNEVSLDLSDFQKIEIPVKGDGREYKILIKDQSAKNSVADYSYQAEFKSLDNKTKKVSLKLSDFKPIYRGRVDMSLPELNKSEITELGIQINDGQAGPYNLLFKEWIAR